MSTNRGFLDLTPAECLSVYQSVMDNGAEFFKTAELLAENNYFGKAITHLILGTEEAIKGLCLLLEGHDFDLRKIKEVQGIFKYHLPGHNIIRDTFSIWMVVRYIYDIKNNHSWRNILANLLKAVITILPAVGNYEWWQTADQLKQRGLYTDYKNGILQPANLIREEYEEAMRRTTPVYKEVLQFADDIARMSPRQLKELRQNFKDADFPTLIAETIKRK